MSAFSPASVLQFAANGRWNLSCANSKVRDCVNGASLSFPPQASDSWNRNVQSGVCLQFQNQFLSLSQDQVFVQFMELRSPGIRESGII